MLSFCVAEIGFKVNHGNAPHSDYWINKDEIANEQIFGQLVSRWARGRPERLGDRPSQRPLTTKLPRERLCGFPRKERAGGW